MDSELHLKAISEYDFSKIVDFPDSDKRIQLVKSWLGQRNKCIRKSWTKSKFKSEQYKKHFVNLAYAWEDKIIRCLNGESLSTVQGKVKVK